MKFHPRDLTHRGFSWNAAISFVNACHLAYKSEGAVRHSWQQASWPADVLQVFSSGPTQGFVVEGDDFVLCAFRGTDTFSDWFTNIGTARVARPYGTAHRGFFLAFQRAEALIRAYAKRAKQSGKAFWLTGHSLGGAIAQIAAHELAGSYDRIGLYTFGQPRTVNANAAHRLTGSLGLDYHRIVNNQDTVTRIPSNFGHSGRLIHFDAMGRPLNGAGKPVGQGAEFGGVEAEVEPDEGAGPTEPPPMTEAEFERRKAEVRALQIEIAGAEMAEEGAFEGEAMSGSGRALEATVEGMMPGVQDHRITEYVRLISRLVSSETRKFETQVSMLRKLSASQHPPVGSIDSGRRVMPEGFFGAAEAVFERPDFEATGFGVPEAPGAPVARMMPLLIKVTGDWAPPPGARVQSRIGDYVTLLVDEQSHQSLQGDAVVNAIEASRDAGIAELDRSLPYVKAEQIHRQPIDERGDAALVGIVDSGVDILHEAFLDTNGKTRILAIWNQRDQRGPSPNSVDPSFSQTYGTLHLHDDLQAQIEAFEQTGQEPHWLLRDGGDGHGTHVAGIAAGRATTRWGDGMAPEAGLLVVIPNMMTAAGDPQSVGYSVSHLDALSFLKTAATGGNTVLAAPRPIAVNVSIGMNAGAHDGSTLLESAVGALTGGGQDDGFVIVKSAGNERTHGGHARVALFQGQVDLEWDSADLERDMDYFEGWYEDSDLSFALRTPLGSRSQQVGLNLRETSETLDGNFCQMKFTRLHHDNGHSRLVIVISPEAVPIRRGTWTLEITGNAIFSADADFHIWVERMDNRAIRFKSDDDETTLSIPGTASHVVTVAACDTGTHPKLTGTSSFGLTRDGRAKPDLAAPGQGVVSARAATRDRAAVAPATGTSVGAPHVTGALALALSRRAKSGRQQFNSNQLAQLLRATVRKVRPTHHPGFGHGILDALALLQEIDREP